MTLTYLWDSADHARLAQLVLFSAAFGFGMAQMPAVKSLTGRRQAPRTGEDSDKIL